MTESHISPDRHAVKDEPFKFTGNGLYQLRNGAAVRIERVDMDSGEIGWREWPVTTAPRPFGTTRHQTHHSLS
jgi:hypothetical protein